MLFSTSAINRYIFVLSGPLGPTQFDSSMFPSTSSLATDSPLATATSTPDASGSEHKHSKHKKKKKKNKKHKHKHKHDREKGERGEHRGEKSSGGGAGGSSSKIERTFSESIILGNPLSSDASNSPGMPNPPSSPEFEVI